MLFEDSPPPGDYRVCLRIGTSVWVEQTLPGTSFRVVAASSTSVASISPDRIPALTPGFVVSLGGVVIGMSVCGSCAFVR